jgi:reactive intermediate/imine deaminase
LVFRRIVDAPELFPGAVMRRFVLLALLGAAACTTQSTPQTSTQANVSSPNVQFINVVENSPYPFSSAVRVGNMLYLAGQMGTKRDSGTMTLVPGGIEAETRQTMENIKEILAKAGSSLEKVVKCSVMMADMAEWPRMNTIYATYFPGPKPARSAWGANGLALGGRVEIECWATV